MNSQTIFGKQQLLRALVLGLTLLSACTAPSDPVPPPPPSPATTVQLEVKTLTLDGAALEGVTVQVVSNGTQSATTSSAGVASLSVAQARLTLKFAKSGFADQFKVVNIPAGATSAVTGATLIAREAAVTLPDIAKGGSLLGKDGVKVSFPPGSLVDSSGAVVTGAVQINLTPVNVALETDAFPGAFSGVATGGATSGIVSFGTAEFLPTQNGQKLQVAPGKKVGIEIPIYSDKNKDGSSVTVGQVIPLWSLNETTGVWTQEGTGVVVANPSSKTGLALRAEVAHFSWWNCDDFAGPEARINLFCKVAAGRTPTDLSAGQSCTVLAQVSNSQGRAVSRAEETINASGLQNARIPAGIVVNLIGTSGSLIGFKSLNLPASQTPVDVTVLLGPAVQVGITQPPEGASLGASATVNATVGSAVDALEVYLDDIKVASDSSVPYELSFSTAAVSEGFHTLQVRAVRDADGGPRVVGLSDLRGVIVDRSAPIINLERLDASLGDGRVNLFAQVQDLSSIAKVEFFSGTVKIGEDASFPYRFAYTLQGTDTPSVSFSAKATDAGGNLGSSAAFIVETAPPSVAISRSPSLATITSSQPVTYTATASDASGIARVEFFKGVQKLAEDSSAPYELVYTVTGADEPTLTVSAKAVDNAGNAASAANSATVNISSNDPVPPVVALDAIPSPVTTVSLELAATATDNVAVAKVEFYANGVLQGETNSVTNGKYRKTVNIGALTGAVTFLARAFDAAGNSADSSRSATVQIPAVDLGGGVRLANTTGCTPSVAVDSSGTPYVVTTQSNPNTGLAKSVTVSRLVANVWQQVGTTLEDTTGFAVSGDGKCAVIAISSNGVPFVGFAQQAVRGAEFNLIVRRFNGVVWETVQSTNVSAGAFDMIADDAGGVIVGRFADSRTTGTGSVLEQYNGRTWIGLASPIEPNSAAIGQILLARRPNGNIVIAYRSSTGPFSSGVFVREWNGTRLNDLRGDIGSSGDTGFSVGLLDLDADASQTYITVLTTPLRICCSIFVRQHDVTSDTWPLVGSLSDQASNRKATTMIQNGTLLQVLPFGAGSTARRWNGSAWSTPVVLPIPIAESVFVRSGNDPLLLYTFDTLCCGASGAVLARINLP